ncbi:MAG: type II CAAX endopeptidase family protein [Clostridium cadaveris]|uniref:CPBP family intramembrane glutamic endopeptidase n=1 Tax=Clostridium cadaveris TaxID=1529 RepID=UPI000C069D5A|nr:type II CAAX endopeptidase family protein [Clostridium cadaveris]MDY4950321.1 type II CAAX endopeptidase family protein [Clostridium cadaveris]NWK11085.1 CPBP family intramembrane metalloprotease [Clostridium cadaveris]
MEERIYKKWKRITSTLFVISIVGTFIIPYLPNEAVLKNSIAMQTSLLSNSLIIFICIVIANKKLHGIYNTFNIGIGKGIEGYTEGLLIGIVMFILVTAGIYFTGNAEVESLNVQSTGLEAVPYILIMFTGWIVQGASEEFLVRGIIMKFLSTKINIFLSVLLSSILFAALHLGNNSIGVLALINLTLFGIVMGLYVIKTNDIWGACGIHTAWNFMQGNIFGFEVSGINVPTGTLIDLNTSGSGFISGGAFGPEAGIICTIVILIVIAVLIYQIFTDKQCLCIFKKT